MKSRIVLLIFIILSSISAVKSQSKYDTAVISNSNYEKLNFKLGSSEIQYFAVAKTDVDIRDGVIEKYKKSKDTIGIRNIGAEFNIQNYEVELSVYNWTKTLFGRQCKYLANQIEVFPKLIISRKISTNELTFLEPELVGNFIKKNYEKRIECIESSDDRYMKKHLINWIRMIENDSIDQFSISFTSHLYDVFSLFDLIVPVNYPDTVICKISKKNQEYPVEFSYQTSKRINPDSSITIHITDDIQDSQSLLHQFMESIYRPMSKHLSKEKRSINDIRMSLMKSVEKSDISLTNKGEFERYIRITESFMLDSDLNPKLSFYNYEIRRIIPSN